MRNYNDVYNRSKKFTLDEKRERIDQERSQIVAAVKREFGINDFRSLRLSEQESYKAMIGKMWNVNEGITEYGKKFLNESAAPLTEKSTDEQIEKFFKREVKANVDNVMNCILNGRDCAVITKTKSTIESSAKRKISPKTYKQWIYDICSKFVGDKIRSIKF